LKGVNIFLEFEKQLLRATLCFDFRDICNDFLYIGAAFSFGFFLFRRPPEREKNTSARTVQRKIAVVTRFFAVKTVRARFYLRLIKNEFKLLYIYHRKKSILLIIKKKGV
jgi:hypothetical protein